ncbi:UNVERIFIED_CONTAM: putative mitochondrial protein [Sesamum latifolium]|uniref:Mitochondrial protein n=1 Tax=Sesamum latifolium TaxID=2727402 RepID=A0AAW2XV91_9LAMI
MIKRIKNPNGFWLEEKQDIQDHIESFFHDIFSSSNPSESDLEECTAGLRSRLDTNMIQELLKPYREDEITNALFHMAPYKSPGPDVKHDIVQCALDILHGHSLFPKFNHTHIVLIPKCKNPELLSQFWPISLCNVIYKIASKVIANRLKPILKQLISPNQSAFVPGRLITDNVLLAFEINHFIKNKRKGKISCMALKLDISKAYDKIEWIFLRKVLEKLGFPQSFTDLIMHCVSSVTYSFMLSGKQFGFLTPQRGLRQGDPLSPYLYLICTEALSSLLYRAEEHEELRGVVVCRTAPKISHLLFADDTLISCSTTRNSMRCVLRILETYEKAAGQKVNVQKSSVAFSPNTPDSLKQEIATEMGVNLETKHEKYLGLPSVIDKKKKEVFCIN